MERGLEQEKNQRVVTFLNRGEVDFLDKIGKDALFSTGMKVSRARLIAWLVDFLKDLNVNGKGITSERDFDERIKRVLKIRSQTKTPPATEGTNSQGGKAMKNLARNLFLATALLLLLGICQSFAGDSKTLTVSCTIPAIPGVNAPALLEQSGSPAQSEPLSDEGKTKKEDSDKDAGYTQLAKEEPETMVLSDAGTVQTLYSR